MRLITNVPRRSLLIASLCLGLFGACGRAKPDARDDLVQALKGANVDGYFFEMSEDDAQIVTSLTNSAARSFIKFDSDKTVVLRYTSVTDRKYRAATIYRAEVTRAGRTLTAVATDVASNEVVSKETFPASRPHDRAGAAGPGPTFGSLEECIQDFDCQQRGPLQCAANKTCRAQPADITCCLASGLCFGVDMLIKPTTTARCSIRSLFPDLDGLVLSP